MNLKNWNSLTKVYCLYTMNYKTSLKKMKEDLNKWRGIYVHGLEDNIVKAAIIPKLIYRFNAIPIKIPMMSFSVMEKKNPILKLL